MLTVINEYMREALSVTVANAMGSSEVLEALYPLLLNRGTPEYLRFDQGPEFSSEPFKDGLNKVGIKPIRIYPGSP
jgi:putative transposase